VYAHTTGLGGYDEKSTGVAAVVTVAVVALCGGGVAAAIAADAPASGAAVVVVLPVVPMTDTIKFLVPLLTIFVVLTKQKKFFVRISLRWSRTDREGISTTRRTGDDAGTDSWLMETQLQFEGSVNNEVALGGVVGGCRRFIPIHWNSFPRRFSPHFTVTAGIGKNNKIISYK
jgi:hypothetical protein